MSALRIKLCGVRRVEDALLCVEAGADELGVIFARKSRRCISLDEAKAIRAAVPARIPLVGVFHDAGADEIAQAAREVPLAAAQLHGALPGLLALESLAELPLPLYRALHVEGRGSLSAQGPLAGFARVLLDGPKGGGSGSRFDWSLVPAARAQLRPPLFLAGGLDADNVEAAIRAARPDGVDVASGIEGKDGFKDPARVHAFVSAARRAASALEDPKGSTQWT